LLVDDEATVLFTLTLILQARGFEVDAASSAESAKQAMATARFDLVITDLKMETATAGYEVTAFAANLHPRPAIIVLSAYPALDSEWRRYGAQAYFQKPTDAGVLMRTVEELLPVAAR
jgi:DNA-binding NtrC family response regulator